MANIDVFKDVLTGVANNIRAARGTGDKIPFSKLVEESSGLEIQPQSYILRDEDGNEFAAVIVDGYVDFDATPDDIRAGKKAATNAGPVVGTKEIPAYHTTEGKVCIQPGDELVVQMFSDKCRFTQLQALICAFNTALEDSVATEKVSIDGSVYPVGSTASISKVSVDDVEQAIRFGIYNDRSYPVVIRYFTYKEE